MNNNAVIYARFSSVGQNEQSIDGQIRVCKEHAEKMGYKIVKVYNDKARTGTNDRRPEFQNMVDEAGLKIFQVILVYKFDRFARNRHDSMLYKAQLRRDHGVRVVSATEPVSDDEGGEIYEMFLEWNDEKYSQRLSKRVRDGMITALENGTYLGTKILYGFKLTDTDKVGKKGTIHKVGICETESEIIKECFQRYADGTPKKAIVDDLNARNITYRGKKFDYKLFDNWFRNPKYIGEFERFGRVWTNIYPAIIDKKLWDKVQEMLDANKIYTRKDSIKQTYYLTGKCFCGLCGGNMVADGGNKPDKVYRYYSCRSSRKRKHNNKSCQKRLEQKEKLELFIISVILEYLKDPKKVSRIADSVIEYYKDRTGEKQIKSLETQIGIAHKQIENTTQAFIEAVAMKSDTLKKSCQVKIDELTILINDLTEQKIQITFENGIQATAQDIINFINDYITPQELESDLDFQKRLYDDLVSACYIYDDRIVVWLSIDGNGGGNKITIDKETTDNAINSIGNEKGTLAVLDGLARTLFGGN
ncbi:MAG: recombinase family protein [Firmicutes bacterium]|nr:recombinase family protein [Bacillota bacterium]